MMSGCNSDHANLGRISSRLSFSTQLGSITKIAGFNNEGVEACGDIEIDHYENIYCVGTTSSSMSASYAGGGSDAFVAKFNRHGNLLWVKQFGTSGTDSCTGAGVDKYGNIYCGGATTQALANPPDLRTNNGAVRVDGMNDLDAFVTKIDPNGNILWIRQFGSTGHDSCNNLAVSPEGNAYCGSKTDDLIGTTYSGVLENIGSTTEDAFVSKINSEGEIQWIRQLGNYNTNFNREGADSCAGVTVDHEENVYCVGTTSSSIGDTFGSGPDVLMWALNKNGQLLHLEQLGVNADAHPEVVNVNASEQCQDVAVDKDKNIYCTAVIVGNLGENSGGGQDVALIKWNSLGDLEWITQLGDTTIINGLNNGNENGIGITVAPNGNIIIAGITSSSTVKSNVGSSDLFFIGFNPSGNIIEAEQIGSTGLDLCNAVKLDNAGNIYCGGSTTGSLGEPNALPGTNDALILRLSSLMKLN